MPRKQSDTSKLAYEVIMRPGAKENTYYKIILALEWIMDGTAWEIAKQARLKPDKVWKRLSELRRDDVIFDTGLRRYSPDGNLAMVYALSSRKEEYKHIGKPEKHYAEGTTTAADYASSLIAKTKGEKLKQKELFENE